MSPPLELVVARHGESLGWLRRVPSEFAITVYDKGDQSSGGTPLPNLGREAHTYLHHLSVRYHSLADLSVFAQGHPFDHAPDLHPYLRALADGSMLTEQSIAGTGKAGCPPARFLGSLGDRKPRRHHIDAPK